MAHIERLEAKGPRGEACIIIRSWVASATLQSGDATGERGQPSYSLATGERLATTDGPTVFETLDRSRRFALRQP